MTKARKKSGKKGKKTLSDKPARALAVADRLAEAYAARIELNFSNPLELAVATILSAQCTDQRVNQVTVSLFRKYRTADDYASADAEVFEAEIRSTGFFRNKTRSVLTFARSLVEKHSGSVPDTMSQLVELAGIGRKTANVILGSGFGKNEGIAVDTHVKRLSQRLGLSDERTPERIERDLMELIPRPEWTNFSLRMIQHGRRTCTARKPGCDGCPVEDICPSAHRVD